MNINNISVKNALDKVKHEAFFMSFIGFIIAAGVGGALFMQSLQSGSTDILSIAVPSVFWLMLFGTSISKVTTFKSKCLQILDHKYSSSTGITFAKKDESVRYLR